MSHQSKVFCNDIECKYEAEPTSFYCKWHSDNLCAQFDVMFEDLMKDHTFSYCAYEECTKYTIDDSIYCAVHLTFTISIPYDMNDDNKEFCIYETCSESAISNSQYCSVHFGSETINFGMAHDAWMRNKQKKDAGYKYTCGVRRRLHEGYCKKNPVRIKQNNKMICIDEPDNAIECVNRMAGLKSSYCKAHQTRLF